MGRKTFFGANICVGLGDFHRRQGGKIIFKQNTLGSSIVEHNIMQPNISDAFKYKIMQSGTRNIMKF